MLYFDQYFIQGCWASWRLLGFLTGSGIGLFQRPASCPPGPNTLDSRVSPSQVASCSSAHRAMGVPTNNTARPVSVQCYADMSDLRTRLREIDSDESQSTITVVLFLASNFSGHLPTLIQRSNRGGRLVLVAENGRVPLPKGVTPGDLAVREYHLGWGLIVFERSLETAIDGARRSLELGESLIILSPAWLRHLLPQSP